MICIDSDCIIDFLNGKKEAIDIFEKYKTEIFTTEINVFEIFYGIYSKSTISQKQELFAELFFNSINILKVGEWGRKSAIIFTDLIKAGNMLEQNDCFIASIIFAQGYNTIITRNVKHFSRIKGLEIITY